MPAVDEKRRSRGRRPHLWSCAGSQSRAWAGLLLTLALLAGCGAATSPGTHPATAATPSSTASGAATPTPTAADSGTNIFVRISQIFPTCGTPTPSCVGQENVDAAPCVSAPGCEASTEAAGRTCSLWSGGLKLDFETVPNQGPLVFHVRSDAPRGNYKIRCTDRGVCCTHTDLLKAPETPTPNGTPAPSATASPSATSARWPARATEMTAARQVAGSSTPGPWQASGATR